MTLALDADGRVYAWGHTSLSLDGKEFISTTKPMAVPTAGTAIAGKKIVQISVGVGFALLLDADGVAYGWGVNRTGQLGMGADAIVGLPATVVTAGTPMAGKRIVQVAAGELHSAAVDSDGQVYASGFNDLGQLGNGTMNNSKVPVAVTTAGTQLEGKRVTQVAVGMRHTLAVTSEGALLSWGKNYDYESGNGAATHATRPLPVQVAGTPLAGKKFTMVGAVELNSAALSSDGKVYTWGDTSGAQLGVGHTNLVRTPVAVVTAGTPMDGKVITDLGVGSGRTVALASDGSIYAWGYNYEWSIGDVWVPGGFITTPLAVGVLPETASVSFGDAPGSDVKRTGDTQITAVAPPHAAGAVEVTVAANGGSVTLPGAFTYQDVPDAPAGVVTALGIESPESTGMVTWDMPAYAGASAVSAFTVSYREVGASDWVSAADPVGATIRTMEIRGLTPKTAYEISVIAANGSGSSVAAVAPFTTDPDRVLASLTLTPEASTVAQGSSTTFTVSGANAAGEPLPVDIANAVLSSDVPGDVVDGATVTFPTAGAREVTAVVSGISATANVTVSPRYAVTWNENWPAAGDPTTEIVEAERLNELPDPSAAGWVIAEWNTRANGTGDTVNLDTDLSAVASGPNLTVYAIWERRTLDVSLSAGTATSGDSVTLTAQANAPFGGTADVTADAEWVSSEAGDTFAAAELRVTAAGTRTITAEYDGVAATASLQVVPGPLAAIELTAAAATVAQGASLDFVVSGTDAAGNTVEIDEQAVALRSSVATDVVRGLTVTFPTASPHVITATVGGVQASMRIEVQPPTAKPGPDSPTTVANTGGPSAGGAAAGALVLAALGTVMILRRRSLRAK